jgi:hypothetical protein
MVASFHMLVLITNTLAFCVLSFLTPWYIFSPLMSFIVFAAFARGDRCPLTTLENVLRRRAEMPQIRGFISHYVMRK